MSMLNPFSHARTRDDAERYKVEPYVVAADVYAAPGHEGRGGWTWYTGSASWSYRVSLEGVLLSTFVLIKQNRMSYLSDRRNHLDLQINMLSEREVTRLLVVTDRIARHVGVATEPADEQAEELSQDTAIDKLMGAIDEKLSEED